MSALEQEVMEKIKLLDKDARKRVLHQLEQDVIEETLVPMSTEEWLEWAIAFGEKIERKYGPRRINSVDLLEEAREERLNDIMGRG
jgi:hypothetical protein